MSIFEKPRADQSGPKRNATGAVNQSGGDGLTEACRDVVEKSVGLGYRVAEEQLRFGERVAEQLNSQLNVVGELQSESQDLTSAFFRSWGDLTARWFDLMSAMVGGRPVSSAPAEPAKPAPPGTPSLCFEVDSERTVRVESTVPPAELHKELSVVPPTLTTPPHHRLKKVKITRSADGKVVLVELSVPSGQAAGTYRGNVFVGAQPVGELIVEVLGAKKTNVNTAGKEELMKLKHVGDVTAQKILDHRKKKGGFDSVEELQEAKIVTKKELKDIAADLTV